MLSRIYGYMALPDEGKAHYSLQNALDKVENGDTVEHREDIDLFDGAKIIWQKEGGGEYRVLVVDKDDVSTLKSLTAPSETAVDAEVREISRLWISFGDGTVVTPYLKKSPGNVGYGELFDYEPEVYPEYLCSDMVIDLMGYDA